MIPDDSPDAPPSDPHALRNEPSVHRLTYSSGGEADPVGLVKIGSLLGGDTARMVAAILEADGIECHVANQNTQALGMHFAGFTQCHIEVPARDAERAARMLKQLLDDPDAVEPAPDDPAAPEPRGDDGEALAVVAAFDHPRSLHEAAAVLGSSRIKPYLPRLVPRGDRPAGIGDRFLLRVDAEEATRAKHLLDDAREEADEDARERRLVRCPRCGRMTGERTFRLSAWVVSLFTLRPAPDSEAHCAPCRHRWTIEE